MTWPAPPDQPPPPPPRPAGDLLTLGWGGALGRGAVAFLAPLAIAALVAVLLAEGVSLASTARAAGFLFAAMHHVGIRFESPPIDVSSLPGSTPVPGGPGELLGSVEVTVSLAVALLLATAVAGWLLYRGGRAVATAAGGPPWARALHGAKVAVPYALLSLGLALAVRFTFPIPAGIPFIPQGGVFKIGPSPVAAFLWPLALGVVFGGMGGLFTARDELFRGEAGRTVLHVLRGGRRMALYGLALAFLALLVNAVVQPDAPLPFSRAYFRAVSESGPRQGAVQLIVTALAIPNMGLLVLVPAMGGSLGAYGADVSFQALSYFRFPVGFDPSALQPGFEPGSVVDPQSAVPFDYGTAPAGYFLYLLVPLVATVLAGWITARRAEARGAGQGAGLGAGAGAVFAVIVALIAVLANLGVGFEGGAAGFGQSGRIQLGVNLFIGAGLALAWGAVGGALGGALGGRRYAGGPGIPGPPDETIETG